MAVSTNCICPYWDKRPKRDDEGWFCQACGGAMPPNPHVENRGAIARAYRKSRLRVVREARRAEGES